jgi:hypothetical protein
MRGCDDLETVGEGGRTGQVDLVDGPRGLDEVDVRITQAGKTISSGARTSRRVGAPDSASMSCRVPAATTRPPATPIASTQPKPVSPASVAIRPSTRRSSVIRVSADPGSRSRRPAPDSRARQA